jgi:DMSO/TMAO reductase YedYZ molybdopterin-dependent catalytic subunit
VELEALSDGEPLSPPTFFLRTAAPSGAVDVTSITLGGLVEAELVVTAEELSSQVVDLGEVFVECSGNSAVGAYGLMSAGQFGGVLLAEVLALVVPRATATMIRVSGRDHAQDQGTSTAGCSWIFRLEDIKGAALVTTMDHEPLSEEHGAPVRLLLPFWFGCCWVKWVDRIDFVGDDEPATSQMVEFASRTHQDGTPALAKDYLPAIIEPCAVATRFERWDVGGQPAFRVVGLLWGGPDVVADLRIALNGVSFGPVEIGAGDVQTWRAWSSRLFWATEVESGEVEIAMSVHDEGVSARRLAWGWYRRKVVIPVG